MNLKNKINLVYNGVYLNIFKDLTTDLEINSIPTILFVGRLINEKDVHLLVPAMSRLNIDVKYLIIDDEINGFISKDNSVDVLVDEIEIAINIMKSD